MDNNEARRQFKSFIATWGLRAPDNRNVFEDDGKLWAYVADDSAKTFRQFYDDCQGVYFRDSFVPREQLKIGAVSRISPTGLVARNVSFKEGE